MNVQLNIKTYINLNFKTYIPGAAKLRLFEPFEKLKIYIGNLRMISCDDLFLEIIFFLENIMNLGQKVENLRMISYISYIISSETPLRLGFTLNSIYW